MHCIKKLLFPTLVLTKSGSKDISQTSYLATPKVYVIQIYAFLMSYKKRGLKIKFQASFFIVFYSLIKGIVEHRNKPSCLAISAYGTSSTVKPCFRSQVFNLVKFFSEIITSSDIENTLLFM